MSKQVTNWLGTTVMRMGEGGVGGFGDGVGFVGASGGMAAIVIGAAGVLFGFGCPSADKSVPCIAGRHEEPATGAAMRDGFPHIRSRTLECFRNQSRWAQWLGFASSSRRHPANPIWKRGN